MDKRELKTQKSPATLQVELACSAEALRATLDELDTALAGNAGRYPVWGSAVDGEPVSDERAWELARDMIREITYADDQEPTHSRIYPALLGVPAQTLAIAARVNQAKRAFHAVLKRCDPVIIEAPDPRSGVLVKQPLLKRALKKLKLERLHRRQATRQLVLIEETPTGFSYFWNRLPKMTKLTREEVIERVDRYPGTDDATRQNDEDKLASIPDDELLVEVRPPHVHPRVRISLESGTRSTRVAVMPVLFLAKADSLRPPLAPLPDKALPERQRLIRQDKKREDKPLITSLPIYRYRPAYRQYGERKPDGKLAITR